MGPVVRALLVIVLAVPCIAVRELPAQRQSNDGFGAAGRRVRVTMHDGVRTIGQLVEVGADSITLLLAEGGESRMFSRSDIDRIALSRGERGNALKGLAIGAGGGLVLGALLGAAAGESCEEEDYLCPDEGFSAVAVGVAGAFAGGLVGTVVGALVRTEKWVDNAILPSSRLSVGIMHKGVGIRILTR